MLTPELLLALSKYQDKDARDAVDPGEYYFEATIRVQGSMKVAPPHQQRVAAKIHWQRVCAHLLGKLNGVTIESVLREVLERNGELTEQAKETEARAKAAMEKILGVTKEEVRGAVKVELSVEEVG